MLWCFYCQLWAGKCRLSYFEWHYFFKGKKRSLYRTLRFSLMVILSSKICQFCGVVVTLQEFIWQKIVILIFSSWNSNIFIWQHVKSKTIYDYIPQLVLNVSCQFSCFIETHTSSYHFNSHVAPSSMFTIVKKTKVGQAPFCITRHKFRW